ncbi:MAG TPA: multiheme c-type cytochrome [Thiobacillaceae bacterium]|nr:multiheme c-type cytochrome [Thiobacillaceae bacterium]
MPGRYRNLHSGWRRLIVAVFLTLVLVGMGYAFLPADRDIGVVTENLPFYSLPFGKNPFAPGEWKTPDGTLVNWRGVPSARNCAECHRQEFMEWNTSLHAVSDLDSIYDASVRRNAGRAHAAAGIGDQKGRWCESCHNPLGTLTGAVNPIIAVQETEAIEEGVSCIVCHTATHPEPLAGNGALTSRINGYFRHLHEGLIMAAPSRHARDMQARRVSPHMGESGLCGACHTEIRPTEVNGQHRMDFQTTFEEWRKSDFPAKGVHCQDCHMARDPGAYITALKRGERPPRGVSHRLVGGNYLLTNPHLPDDLVIALRGGPPTGINRFFDRDEYMRMLDITHQQVEGLLKSAAEVEVESRMGKPGTLKIRVRVSNTGAGHALPTGPLDQRHMWLEVKVLDSAGETVFHSGAFDTETGRTDASAVMWVKRMEDKDGRLDLRHTLFDVERLNYPRRPIPAGGSQLVNYDVPLPAGSPEPYRVQARLWYRIAFQEILDNVKEEGLGDHTDVIIPPLLMATSETVSMPAARLAVLTDRSEGRP